MTLLPPRSVQRPAAPGTRTVPQSEVFLVLGAQKTASSTLVGILNCHPRVMTLYETDLAHVRVSRYGTRLIDACPAARGHFTQTATPTENYRALHKALAAQGHVYDRLGDKLITLDPAFLGQVADIPLIVTTRDLRTWLVKSAIVEIYRTDVDAMPAALAFTRFLVESHRHPNALHVAVEDLVTRNDQVIDALGQHLDIDLAPHAAGWDRKIGCYHDKLKMAQSWYSGHQSSNLFDGRLDSRVTLKPHAAWDAILPIFDRYHRRAEPAETAEIDADLERLDSLATLGPVPLRDLYDEIDTATRKLPKARKYLYSAYRKAPALVRPLTRLAR